MTRSSALVLSGLVLSASAAVATPLANSTHYEARWIVPHDKGTREVKTILSLEDDSIVLRSLSGETLRSLPYASLKIASHSTARPRRWVSGLIAGSIYPLGYGLLLTRSKQHFITFFQEDTATAVKLDGVAYASVLEEIATRTSQPLIPASR